MPRAEKRRVHRLPQAPRSGAELYKPPVVLGAEASSLDRDARGEKTHA
jgi:hypothetical protein